MKAQEFRDGLPVRLRLSLPTEWRDFHHQQKFGLFQLWYDEPAFHFEVAPQLKSGWIEVGLHFEHKVAARNAALHAAFDRRFIEVRHALGAGMHLEKWDRGWHKLYTTLPHPGYTPALLEQVAAELARQITLLQPMLRAALAEGAGRG